FRFTIPAHITTQEYFRLTRDKLAPGGILVLNTIETLSPHTPSFLYSEIKTFQTVYPNSYFFAVSSPQTNDLQNIILVGYNDSAEINFHELGNSSDPFLRTLPEKIIDASALDLTDRPIF